MINKAAFDAISELCDQRDLEEEIVFDALAKGIVNAYKKENDVQNVVCHFNKEKHEITVARFYNVIQDGVEYDPEDTSYVTLEEAKKIKRGVKAGDYFEVNQPFSPQDFGRINISASKQIFNQETKKFERERAYNHFAQLENDTIEGTIVNVKDNIVTFDCGMNTIATLRKNELAKEEIYLNSKIKLYLVKVEMTTKGPRLTISRSDKNLIKRLLEQYIPEFNDGTLEVMGIARDSGDRTKVCIKSNDPNKDPIGSCVGTKSKRINDILNALNGEKIDIYAYSTDPVTLIKNALQPAEVYKVIVDEKNKSAICVVPNDHLSLAIGKKGQNVRLAVQSSGWKIDIKSVDVALEEGIEF